MADDDSISGFRMRCPQSKLIIVRALQSCRFETIAADDNHNDLAMIRVNEAGFLFRSTEAIKAESPDLSAFEECGALSIAIEEALAA